MFCVSRGLHCGRNSETDGGVSTYVPWTLYRDMAWREMYMSYVQEEGVQRAIIIEIKWNLFKEDFNIALRRYIYSIVHFDLRDINIIFVIKIGTTFILCYDLYCKLYHRVKHRNIESCPHMPEVRGRCRTPAEVFSVFILYGISGSGCEDKCQKLSPPPNYSPPPPASPSFILLSPLKFINKIYSVMASIFVT